VGRLPFITIAAADLPFIRYLRTRRTSHDLPYILMLPKNQLDQLAQCYLLIAN